MGRSGIVEKVVSPQIVLIKLKGGGEIERALGQTTPLVPQCILKRQCVSAVRPFVCKNMFWMLFLASLPLQNWGSSTTQIVLGGSWFSKTNLGTSNGYMMSEWSEKVLNPIIMRIAEKILANQLKMAEMQWFLLSLFLWNSLLMLALVYKYIRGLKFRRENV